ncbi:acyl-CoA thioester hydrolase [Methylobacterium variabile]|jgi:acyl-CoA thioesterase YciA|uniref:Acyl-CoA thioester hydrolase n=1 Tax=Methylobacterium variabile TaxID=298794 RepID=A0A0J6TA54_9HYPH|nr:acyl-CoA thioesterase [Methylobacterium variabile]KMO42473.1 acyl-CoA thioester hydrolase [Methylobacterium variabile]
MSSTPPAPLAAWGPPVIRTIAMPADTNPAGDIFGGWLMAQMDLAAGNVAARRARGRCATIAVEGMTFLQPVVVGDEVSLYAHIVSVGRSSIRIQIEAWRRARENEETIKVTQALFTFVAIDENRRPRAVPPDTAATGGTGSDPA